MIQRVSPLDLRQRLGDLLNRVALRQDEYVIERKGKPLAAMVSVEKLRSIEQLARLILSDALSKSRSRLSEAEADALANEAKHRSRKGGRRRK